MAKGLKSKKITSTAVVTTAGKSGLLWGYNLIGGTTGSKAIFKNGGTSGTDTWAGTTLAGTAVGDVTASEHFSQPVVFSTDLYCTLSGTGAYVYVIYEEIEG
jgi:hypothetical protein